jgi:hypothetical protein
VCALCSNFPAYFSFFKKKYKRNLITGLREQNRRSPPKVPNNSKGHMRVDAQNCSLPCFLENNGIAYQYGI